MEKNLDKETVVIFLAYGESPDNEPIFAYVAVRGDKVTEFVEAQKSGRFYPDDYGIVIESGKGEPSAEVRMKMETDYGFKHEAMKDVATDPL